MSLLSTLIAIAITWVLALSAKTVAQIFDAHEFIEHDRFVCNSLRRDGFSEFDIAAAQAEAGRGYWGPDV